MTKRSKSGRPKEDQHEAPAFVPRIVNPVKIEEVVIFSAEEEVRRATTAILAQMPWLRARVLTNPAAVPATRFKKGTAFIVDDMALSILDVDMVRENNADCVIVLLSFIRLIWCSPPSVARQEFPYTEKADLVFAVNRGDLRPEKIIVSAIRAAEDHLNIRKRPDIRRFILLLVDDEPSWPSQFLPVLYGIIGQRAAVKITRTYEEALTFVFGVDSESKIAENYTEVGFGDQVVCLITDIFFPRGENLNGDAGKDLIDLVNRRYPRIPIIIASKAKESSQLSEKGFLLPKGDPGSLETLKGYLRDRTGVGDFVIFDDSGKELHRLKNVRELYHLLSKAERDDRGAGTLRSILEAYGDKDMFSTWFYMHGMRELGDKLRPQRLKGMQMISLLKKSLEAEMAQMRLTPMMLGGIKIFEPVDLLPALKNIPSKELDAISHDDVISSWLDRKGYCELADELRPIHGRGMGLKKAIVGCVENWVAMENKSHSRNSSGRIRRGLN
jgi:hypothetical protein